MSGFKRRVTLGLWPFIDDRVWLFSALDKREYLMIIRDNFCEFFIKTYIVTPHLNRLIKAVQVRGHNVWFH